MAGLALGPLVGGVLLDRFWWGSAFLLGVPFMVLLLILGPTLLPEYRTADPGRLDLTSVSRSLATILPIIYGLKAIARNGWGWVPDAAIVAGRVSGTSFSRRQNALSSGLRLVPQNAAMIAGSLGAPLFARRIRPAFVMSAGLVIAASGLLLQTQVASVGGLGLLVAGLVLASGGIALPLPLTTNLMLTSTPRERAGSVASGSETGAECGIALGVAALGTLGTLVYRSCRARSDAVG